MLSAARAQPGGPRADTGRAPARRVLGPSGSCSRQWWRSSAFSNHDRQPFRRVYPVGTFSGGSQGNPRLLFFRLGSGAWSRFPSRASRARGKSNTGAIYRLSRESFRTRGRKSLQSIWRTMASLRICLPYTVVEVPATVDAKGVHGKALGRLPRGFAGLLNNQVAVDDLTVEAVLQGSRELALQALLVDPLVDSVVAAERTLDAILSLQEQAFFPASISTEERPLERTWISSLTPG